MKQNNLLKYFFFVASILITNCLFSQTIRIAPGATISNLKWSTSPGSYIFDELSVQPAAFVGIEYFNKGAFTISSNVGYHYKAGSELIFISDSPGNGYREDVFHAKLGYVTLNTLVDFKLKGPRFTPFASVGPRVDMKVYDKKFQGELFNDFIFGMNTGLGVKFNTGNIGIGVKADYLISFNNLATLKDTKVRDNTFLISVFIDLPLK
ncbi:MAG: hypothetical protein JNK20_12400 [Flavipsychrobacter sp.]|jgi:hypothetical protein|nr:hypothetical protein [Flavipsychrobacter sp.]